LNSVKWISVALVIAALGYVASSTHAATQTATITTNKPHYAVGETMIVSGTGFAPSNVIALSVQTPDHLTENVPGVTSDSAGAFVASYTPSNPQPGRYKFTASDGATTANTATTQADAIAYNKGVYNKGTTAPNDATGTWTTGNAGSNYLENQWAYYQYQIAGIATGATPPSLDVVFNHWQQNSNAVFIDAFANFRVCLDCDLTDPTHTDSSGPGQALLSNGNPYPVDATTAWKLATVGVNLDNSKVISAVNQPSANNTACPVSSADPTNTPSADHCFHVSGSALASVFSAGLAADRPDGKDHRITIFYAAHLAATFVWIPGNEALLGCTTSINYVHPYPPTMPDPTAWGTTAYGTGDPCSKADAGDWTASIQGVGAATGSSRHFEIDNQTDGSSGGITLPIPTVPAPANHIIITKVTNPANSGTSTFGYTGSLGSFTLDTNSGDATNPNTITFDNIATGVPYTITEGSTTGWSLTNLSCSVTGGTDTGGTITPASPGSATATASITLGALDSGVTVTCVYTNIKNATITLVKNYTPTTDSGTNFSIAATQPGSNITSPVVLTTDGTGTKSSGALTITAFGNYSFLETVASGWTGTGTANCALTGGGTTNGSSATQTATINVTAGQNWTCTFTNAKNASITLVKNYTPTTDSGTTFAVTPTQPAGGPVTNPTNLVTNATGTRSSGAISVLPAAFGSYSFAEGAVTGWTGTGTADCVLTGGATSAGSSATQTATITVAAGQSWTCTFTNAKNASITLVKNYTPTTDSGTTFAITPTQPAGGPVTSPTNLVTNATGTRSSGAITVLPSKFGNYSFAEGAVTGWSGTGTANCVLTGGATSTGSSATQTATIAVAAGQSWTCTFTNIKLATVRLLKTQSGGVLTGAASFTFEIRTGASAAADGALVAGGSGTANAANSGAVTFAALLNPSGTYQFCETNLPVAWNTTISTLTGAFQTPTGAVCVPFGVGTAFLLTPGGQLVFTIDNTPPPGGGTRTIGYWKNWSSCDGHGNQAHSLDQNLPQTIGDLTLAGGDPSPDCLKAIAILDKSDYKSGKKMASDPAYNMAAQLLGAMLNVTAGAGTCANSTLAIASGQALLDQIGFDGTGTYANKMSATQITVANTLAGILDAYNQDNSVCSSLPVPPSIVFTSANNVSKSAATNLPAFTATATANPGPAPTFSLVAPPAGVSITSAGVLNVTPATAPGIYTLKIAATSWGVVYQTFTLTVTL